MYYEGQEIRLKKYLGTHHISKILGVQWSEAWPDTLYKVEDRLYVSCISYDRETSPVPGRPLWVLEAVDGEVPLDSIYRLAWNTANIEGGKNRKGLCSISKMQCRKPCILNHETEKSNTRSVGYEKKKTAVWGFYQASRENSNAVPWGSRAELCYLSWKIIPIWQNNSGCTTGPCRGKKPGFRTSSDQLLRTMHRKLSYVKSTELDGSIGRSHSFIWIQAQEKERAEDKFMNRKSRSVCLSTLFHLCFFLGSDQQIHGLSLWAADAGGTSPALFIQVCWLSTGYKLEKDGSHTAASLGRMP